MVQRFSFFILFLFLLNLHVSKTVFGAPEKDKGFETEEKLGFVPVETTPEEAYAEKVRTSVKEKEEDAEETAGTEEGEKRDSGIPPVSAEAMDAIAERMKSLTQSLNNMPQPPSFKHKINLPGDGIVPQEPAGQKAEEKNEQEEKS